MWSIPLQIYEAARASARARLSLPLFPSVPLSLLLSISPCPSPVRMLSSRVGPATLPTARFAIAFTYELNYYTLLPTYRVAAVSIARCPLNNERIIRDKSSNGENALNHAELSLPFGLLLLLRLVPLPPRPLAGLRIGQFLTRHIIDVSRRIALKAKSTGAR